MEVWKLDGRLGLSRLGLEDVLTRTHSRRKGFPPDRIVRASWILHATWRPAHNRRKTGKKIVYTSIEAVTHMYSPLGFGQPPSASFRENSSDIGYRARTRRPYQIHGSSMASGLHLGSGAASHTTNTPERGVLTCLQQYRYSSCEMGVGCPLGLFSSSQAWHLSRPR